MTLSDSIKNTEVKEIKVEQKAMIVKNFDDNFSKIGLDDNFKPISSYFKHKYSYYDKNLCPHLIQYIHEGAFGCFSRQG